MRIHRHDGFLRLAECRKPCFAYTAKKNDVCPLFIVMVTAFLEWGGEAIEELPMALAMFDAAVENERKTDPMMPTISYGYAT